MNVNLEGFDKLTVEEGEWSNLEISTIDSLRSNVSQCRVILCRVFTETFEVEKIISLGCG